jgi:hypothetical protein
MLLSIYSKAKRATKVTKGTKKGGGQSWTFERFLVGVRGGKSNKSNKRNGVRADSRIEMILELILY